jgi:DNA-binding NtrC family response regulator
MARKRILLVDDDSYHREPIQIALETAGYEVQTAANGKEALKQLEEGEFDLILSDLKMPVMNGMELLAAVEAHHPGVPLLIITAHGSVDNAVEAMKRGARDYIQKPIQLDELELKVSRELEVRAKDTEIKRLRSELQDKYRFSNMIGKSRNMEQVFDLIDTVADSRATILVTGESGTGKELVARALHYHSTRANGPFIRINCAALPKELMESELFGHEKGAFTGAIKQTRGRFEMADGGTLLLDEISEIDPALQAKLLRVLQEREFERIGSAHTIKVDVRIIATTNRVLQQEVEAGHFREDLFYRLNVIEINLPPLRERKEDIPTLVRHFIDRFTKENGKATSGIADAALERLVQHDWPGNVRELENYIERAVVVSRGPLLAMEDFPQRMNAGPRNRVEEDGLQVGLTVYEMERRLIMKSLEACQGNRTEAATRLGISTRTLRNKLHEYGAMDAFKENGKSTDPEEALAAADA